MEYQENISNIILKDIKSIIKLISESTNGQASSTLLEVKKLKNKSIQF